MIYRKAEYIWVGGDGELRSKTRIFKIHSGTSNVLDVNSLNNLPVWNYDGSSTNQAPGSDSEVLLKPRAVYLNPFISIGYGNTLDSLSYVIHGCQMEVHMKQILDILLKVYLMKRLILNPGLEWSKNFL